MEEIIVRLGIVDPVTGGRVPRVQRLLAAAGELPRKRRVDQTYRRYQALWSPGSPADTTIGYERPMVTRAQAERFVRGFAEGWSAPHPDAWNDLFVPDAVFEQPLLVSGQGLPLFQGEFARLFALLPDMKGEIVRWGLAEDAVLIELACTASAGGRTLRFVVVDRCVLDGDGLCTCRTTYMNPIPVALALASRPSSWPSWWRSGLGPLTVRRRLFRNSGRRAAAPWA
jgi:SnoaL-like domain